MKDENILMVRHVILYLLLKVDGAGDGDCIAVLRQDGDMSGPVILRRVEVGPIIARVVLRPIVVNPPVPVRRPRLTRDVSHNLNFEKKFRLCRGSPLYWYRGVTVLLLGWVIWKFWNFPCKFFSLDSWLVSALSISHGGQKDTIPLLT